MEKESLAGPWPAMGDFERAGLQGAGPDALIFPEAAIVPRWIARRSRSSYRDSHQSLRRAGQLSDDLAAVIEGAL